MRCRNSNQLRLAVLLSALGAVMMHLYPTDYNHDYQRLANLLSTAIDLLVIEIREAVTLSERLQLRRGPLLLLPLSLHRILPVSCNTPVPQPSRVTITLLDCMPHTDVHDRDTNIWLERYVALASLLLGHVRIPVPRPNQSYCHKHHSKVRQCKPENVEWVVAAGMEGWVGES